MTTPPLNQASPSDRAAQPHQVTTALTSAAATRALPFTNLFNFRDIGGYSGIDGRTVRWQRLYRADSLHRIDEVDQVTFAALGVRTVLDLRRPREVNRYGRVPEYDGLAYQHIHPEHQEWDEVLHDEQVEVARWLADRYMDLAETGHVGLATALGVIAEEQAAPVVVHCMAGKDRTGVVCALTLSLLGVNDADIAEDYAISAAASQRFTAWRRSVNPHSTPLPAAFLAAPAEAMLLFLTELRERHGSVRQYLLDAGLTSRQIADLQTHLLT